MTTDQEARTVNTSFSSGGVRRKFPVFFNDDKSLKIPSTVTIELSEYTKRLHQLFGMIIVRD